jgi:hypothetical protein
MHNFGTQISRSPRPQRGAHKHEQGARSDRHSRERSGIRAAGRYRRCDQMSKCDDERSAIDRREEKSYEKNRTDDPESFFELEFTGGHSRICSGDCDQLQNLRLTVS